jgi:hypothetical protein
VRQGWSAGRRRAPAGRPRRLRLGRRAWAGASAGAGLPVHRTRVHRARRPAAAAERAALLLASPSPLGALRAFFLAASNTGRSSALRRCGMWKLPVPRRLAPSPLRARGRVGGRALSLRRRWHAAATRGLARRRRCDPARAAPPAQPLHVVQVRPPRPGHRCGAARPQAPGRRGPQLSATTRGARRGGGPQPARRRPLGRQPGNHAAEVAREDARRTFKATTKRM